MVRRSVLAQCVAGVLVVCLVSASVASARETTKQILQRIEETLAPIITLVTPPPPPPPPAFPYAHGYAILTDGPIGQSNIGGTVQALVLPHSRTRLVAESLGQ